MCMRAIPSIGATYSIQIAQIGKIENATLLHKANANGKDKIKWLCLYEK